MNYISFQNHFVNNNHKKLWIKDDGNKGNEVIVFRVKNFKSPTLELDFPSIADIKIS